MNNTSLTVNLINELLGITESYKASDKLMMILFDKEKREQLFKEFLEHEWNLDYEWFHMYFQDEQADRKTKKQDFTPDSIGKLLSKMIGNGGSTLDIAAGTGGLTIQKWVADKYSTKFWEYRPSMFFYSCEELSDRALPFLLFNLLIRGMNATVVHGDTLKREVKQIYFIQNDTDSYTSFSSLNVMPHSEVTEKEFQVHKWLEGSIEHIESPEPEFIKEVRKETSEWQ